MNAKTKLLEIIAGRDRGLLVSEADRVRILGAIGQLEDSNPNPKPIEVKHLLSGNWRLLFTTSRGILGIARLPLWRSGHIYQAIDADAARLYNIAEIIGPPLLEGVLVVVATFEPVSENRVAVRFERSIAGLQRALDYRSVREFIEAIESGRKFPPLDLALDNGERRGWLDTTYLDEDLRVGRGNEGSVFVLARERD